MSFLLIIAAQAAAASPFGAPAVSPQALDRIAGQADVAQQITAKNTAQVAGNRITGDSVTGGIRFDAGSFSQMNGLSVLSANTGNNVAINASMNVNVSIRP